MAKLSKTTTIGGIPIVDLFYPIGTIYLTEDDAFNPQTQWGGNWEKIKNRFIYGTGENSSGLTGGETEHTLTINEMPKHTHKVRYVGSNANGIYGGQPGTSKDANPAPNELILAYEGGGQAHNNMPPYYTANIWRRVS